MFFKKKSRNSNRKWRTGIISMLCAFMALSAVVTEPLEAHAQASGIKEEVFEYLPLHANGSPDIVGRYQFNYTGNWNYISHVDEVHRVEWGKDSQNVLYDPNSPSNFFNSSKGTLTNSSGAKGIVKAYLIWETRKAYDAGDYNSNHVRFIMRDGAWKDVYPDNAYCDNRTFINWRNPARSSYCMVADVTGIVQAYSYGDYYVANVPVYNPVTDYNDNGGGMNPAAWQLVVIEEGDNFPVRAVTMKVGATFRFGDWNFDNYNGGYTYPNGNVYNASNFRTLSTAVTFNNGIKTKSTGNVTGQVLVGCIDDPGNPSYLGSALYTQPSAGGNRTIASAGSYPNMGLCRNNAIFEDDKCVSVNLSDISGGLGNNATVIGAELNNIFWNTQFFVGVAMDIAFPDFSSYQTTTVNSSTSVTVSGKITNTSPQENTGIYNGNLTVDLDSGLVTDASRCTVTVNGVRAAASTSVSYEGDHYQVQFYGGSIVNFMRGNTIEYSIDCSTNGSGKTRFDNKDTFNGFLRADGADTGYWVDRAWTASSYALAKFHVTVISSPLSYGQPFRNVSGTGDYTFGSYVNATATLNPGYSFAGWTGTYSSMSNPFLFKMPAQDVTLYANVTDDPPGVTLSGVSGAWSATADSSDVTSPWLRENVALTANASDLGSGLRKVAVVSGNSAVKSVAYDGEQSGNAGYTVQTEGTTTYYGTATDRNGSTGTSKKLTVRLDKTAPGGTSRVKEWTEEDHATTFKANINDTKDGTFTDVSKVKRVYVEVWNEDDPSDKKTYTLDRTEGDSLSGKYSVSMDLFKEFPTAAYLKCAVYAEDNAGNTGEIPCTMPEGGHIQNFFITAYITRDDPNTSDWMGEWCTDPTTGRKDIQDNDFISGQYGTMHIYTYGYVESVDISFPDAFAQAAAKDNSLGIETVPAGGVNIVTDPAVNPAVVVTDDGCGRSVEYNFKVPLYMHEWLDHYGSGEDTKYTRTWFIATDTGHKGSATCEAYPALRVGGDMCVSLVDTIRTRLRDSESY